MNRMLAQSYVVKLHKYRCRVVGDQFPFVFIPVQDVFNDDSKENNAITKYEKSDHFRGENSDSRVNFFLVWRHFG